MSKKPQNKENHMRHWKKNKKNKDFKIPKSKKKYSVKSFKIGFTCLVVFVSISGVLAFIRSINTGIKVIDVKSDVTKISKNIDRIESQNISYTPELEHFSNKVVDLYMNVPADEMGQEQRVKDLRSVYANGLKEDSTLGKGERKLADSTFLNLERVNGVNTAKYKVDYQVIGTQKVTKEVDEKYKEGDKEKTRKVKKEVDEKVTTNVTNVLCIPYVKENNNLSVVASPYLQSYTESKANAKSLKADEAGMTVSIRKVDKFVKVFCEKYANSKPSEMQFLMSNPESLNGTVGFASVESNTYKEGKGYKVYADVYFKENGTSIKRHEQMTLHLKRNDKTFYVTKLVHNFEK